MNLKLFITLLLCGTCIGASCQSRCGDSFDGSMSCQCNTACETHSDCCSDYYTICKSSSDSCSGRCGDNLDNSYSCQCNSYCERYGDCCSDYEKECTDAGGSCSPKSISNDEILQLSDELYLLDVNRAKKGDIVVNIQSQTSDSSSTDLASQPFFSYVNPNLMLKNTYKKLIALQDNYEKYQGTDDVFSDQQLIEQDSFLDEVLDTDIGARLYDFFAEKDILGCESASKSYFKQLLKDIWFGLYSRKNGAMDTSGFEHVFVGEISGSSVSGFHNWIQIYQQELAGNLDYFGYTDISEPNLYGLHFEWFGRMKGLSGSLVGSSPEYDLAIFTLCHIARPDSQCSVNLRNSYGSTVTQKIQTWTWAKSQPAEDREYVASAYFLA